MGSMNFGVLGLALGFYKGFYEKRAEGLGFRA